MSASYGATERVDTPSSHRDHLQHRRRRQWIARVGGCAAMLAAVAVLGVATSTRARSNGASGPSLAADPGVASSSPEGRDPSSVLTGPTDSGGPTAVSSPPARTHTHNRTRTHTHKQRSSAAYSLDVAGADDDERDNDQAAVHGDDDDGDGDSTAVPGDDDDGDDDPTAAVPGDDDDGTGDDDQTAAAADVTNTPTGAPTRAPVMHPTPASSLPAPTTSGATDNKRRADDERRSGRHRRRRPDRLAIDRRRRRR